MNSPDLNLLLVIEGVLIFSLVVLEVYLAKETYRQIKIYESIFQKMPTIGFDFIKTQVDESGNEIAIRLEEEPSRKTKNIHKVGQLFINSKNRILKSIVDAINAYLLNNRGASIDYHIIKEIITRNIESEESSIESKLPSPLYVGLAATMVGIIIGLLSIDFQSASLSAIKPLIDGVKIAMGASVIGLGLTTWLSIHVYKNSKSKADEGRNKFISLLQTDLLPTVMGPGQSGMTVLANKLDEFGRKTSDSVTELGMIVENSNEQVNASQVLLRKIEELDLRRITGANAEMFHTLSGLMDSFYAFPNYYMELNRSLGQTSNLVNNLSKLLEQSENIDSVLSEIKLSIDRSRDATEFFNKHIKEFVAYGSAVNGAVENADQQITRAVNVLEARTTDLFNNFNSLMESYDHQLSRAFENSRPKFENLNHLVTIKTEMEKLNKLLSKNLNKSNPAIGEPLGPTDDEVTSPPSPQKKNWLDISYKVFMILGSATVISYGVHSLYTYWWK